MAWFECTTGASSGNGVALIVTTDASFAGSNITASNGEDTFTQQCPSSAPYVVTFENIPTGTYTISGVTGGQTVSKTFVVSDYNFEFHNTPTGSTATPVNVIQTWLHCANIWNKSYTTINQVLADTSTLLALISSNNAADYMARSTNWASSVCANQTAMGYIGNNDYCTNKLLSNSTWLNAICNSTYMESVLNVKVPTMTSNTAPSGTVASTGLSDATTAYYVFDGDNNNFVYENNGDVLTISYSFGKNVKIYMMQYNLSYSSGYSYVTSADIKIYSGNTPTKILSLSNPSTSDTMNNAVVSTLASGDKISFEMTGASGWYVSLKALQFYGRNA